VTNAEIAEYLSGHPNANDEYDLIELTGLNGVGRFHARYGRVMPISRRGLLLCDRCFRFAGQLVDEGKAVFGLD
jgi:hypothetical protein